MRGEDKTKYIGDQGEKIQPWSVAMIWGLRGVTGLVDAPH